MKQNLCKARFRSVSARQYVLHDPEKLTDKYITAWTNFGISVSDIKVFETFLYMNVNANRNGVKSSSNDGQIF